MRIKVTIEGVTPLLMNRFTEQAEVQLASGISGTMRGDRGTPREQAAVKRYCDEQGNLYLPGSMIFATLISAGVFHRLGRKQLTTRDTSLVPAALTVEDLVCPLGTKEWEVDSRSVVIPATGGRVMCHRPRVDHWTLAFTLDADTTMFGANLVRLLVDDAGKKMGLGDFRPSKKGPFGKFVVREWAVLEGDLREVA